MGGGEKQERKEKKGRVETPTDATARRTWESSHGPKSRSSAAAARLVLRPSNKTVKTKQKNVSSTHRWTVYMYTITDASLEFRSTGRKCFVIHIHKTKECAIKVQPNSNLAPNYSSSFQIKFFQEFV